MRNNNEILDDDFREEENIIPIEYSYEKENRHLKYAQGLIEYISPILCVQRED